jgi:hypothetical protein
MGGYGDGNPPAQARGAAAVGEVIPGIKQAFACEP